MSFLNYLISGISLGSVYAIIALGYTMVYGIAKMLNFAHGDVIMVGAYVVFYSTAAGMPAIPAVLLSVVICTVLGMVIEAVAYRPLRSAASPLAVLITAIGVSYLLQNLALLFWSSNTKSFTSVVKIPALKVAGLNISGETMVTILACIVIVVGLTLFINKTKPGQAMLAVSEDKGAAQLMGINVNATIALTFAIGSGLAAIAGVLLCSAYPSLTPYTGSMPGIKAFVAAVFGGIGSIPGAMIGGILLGIIEIFGKAYISSQMADAKTAKQNAITYGIVIIGFLIMQIISATGHMSSSLSGLLIPFCYYVILAVSLNLVVGILGELSLGHAGFMCVGAFSSVFFTKCMENVITNSLVRFIIALIIGALVAAVFGILIGIPVLRLKGDYLAIVTLAFGEIIKNLVNVLFIGKDSHGLHFSMKDTLSLGMEPDGQVIVNGPQGITGIPKDSTFVIGVVLVLITLFIVLRLINSRDGRAIQSIRDNRIAAESIGINVTKYKLMAFSVSAGLAGIGGALYAHNLSTLSATPKNFGYNMSIMILVYVVLGGIGNIRGSVIAPIVLNLVLDYFLRKLQMLGSNPVLQFLSDNRMLVYAIVLIVIMLFSWSPKMIEWRERVFHKNAKEEA